MKNLVILWGWTRNEKSYQKLIESAPKNWKIYPVSYEQLMPHGNVNVFKENFLKFLQQNQLDKFYLMGHSLGGALAIDFAYHNPEKVQQLFLIDSEGVYQSQSIFKVARKVLGRHKKYQSLPDPTWASVRRIIMSPILHARLGYHAYSVDLQKEASNIKVPTTILWAEDDGVTPLIQGEKLHQLINKSKLIVLKDEGHDWILYNPHLFWQSILPKNIATSV